MQPDATLANPTILKGLVAAPRAWHGPDLVEDDFKILLTGDCIAELETIIAEQRKAPVPTLVLQPEHFKMDACRKLMQGAKQRLDGGLLETEANSKYVGAGPGDAAVVEVDAVWPNGADPDLDAGK